MMEPLDASELGVDAALLSSPHKQRQQLTPTGDNGQLPVAVPTAAASSKAATAWSSSYSSALSKSMRAMIGVHRLRKSSTESDSEVVNYNSRGHVTIAATTTQVAKNDDAEQAHARLLLAIENKDEQEISELVAQNLQALRMLDEV